MCNENLHFSCASFKQISDEFVVLDVNNPLVDQWLTFEVELVSVEEES